MAQKISHDQIIQNDLVVVNEKSVRRSHPNLLQLVFIWLLSKNNYRDSWITIGITSFAQAIFLPIPLIALFLIFSIRHKNHIFSLFSIAFLMSILGSFFGYGLAYFFPEFVQKWLFQLATFRSLIFFMVDQLTSLNKTSILPLLFLPIPNFLIVMTGASVPIANLTGEYHLFSHPAMSSMILIILAGNFIQLGLVVVANYFWSKKIIYMIERKFNSFLFLGIIIATIVYFLWKIF